MSLQDRLVRGLTFEDILIVPGFSQTLPRDVDISTMLVPGVRLNIPLLSSPMDRVTEASLAIALARAGGMGVIHKNLTPGKQADEVRKVKRSQAGVVVDPHRLHENNTVADARELMQLYNISGIPIVDEENRLKGILTNRDIRLIPTNADGKPVSDFMTKDLIVGYPGIPIAEATKLLHEHRIEKLPLVDDNYRLVGLITIQDISKKEKYPFASVDKEQRLLVGAAVGVGPKELDRAGELVQAEIDVLFLDSSHAHSIAMIDATRRLKALFPHMPLVVGNVATTAGAQAVLDAGADGIKVGIGPGTICTTRIVTGGGVPQVTAIDWAAETGCKYIIADGGIRYSGDIVKAIAVGATSVMIGSLFAGTTESPGKMTIVDGKEYKEYRGMGSLSAMKKGSADRYFQDPTSSGKMVAEGVEGLVLLKGSVADVVFQLVGGLRQGMGLAGVKTLSELQHVPLVEVTAASIRESHPHDLAFIFDAPNYRSN